MEVNGLKLQTLTLFETEILFIFNCSRQTIGNNNDIMLTFSGREIYRNTVESYGYIGLS